MFADKTILITGGSGSFGTAFSKHLLAHPPKKLIIFSRGWLKQQELREELGAPPWARFFIGDVRDKDRLIRAMRGVDICIHAAALKDLPTCEYNPSEAMLTNVVGTMNVIDACIARNVGKSILISTDKAVNPVNTYGKTKALAESLWLGANKYSADDRVVFSVCRYGNVWGSSGSILPVWKKLIAEGAGYLPVTDERMTRFLFKMSNAVQFVADCIAKMKGGEIFIPTLPSVRVTDIAKALNMPYKVTGIREGEKIDETMGTYLEDGTLLTSGNNPRFMTVEEIRQIL